MKLGFAARLTATLAGLLLLFGSAMAAMGLQLAQDRQDRALQRLSAGLALHVLNHWPVVSAPGVDAGDTGARGKLIEMLMTVNPGIQVYTLDADGRVQSYFGPPGMVQRWQLDLAPVRAFLAGGPLPLRGLDPMGGPQPRLFSAAMFPPRADDTRPQGYLYIVLDGAAHRAAAAHAGERDVRVAVAWLLAGVAGLTLGIGAWLFRRQARGEREAIVMARERELAAAHREHMAQLAHDLRTPLTALHGLLEALPTGDTSRGRALAQSERVQRLTENLFELASLEASEQVTAHDRFALDELVSDTVQKFGAEAVLDGPAPGRLEVQGDWQLVERALSNLIDNALRHAGSVRVSLARVGALVEIRVRDDGPGLPEALRARLLTGQSLRHPPLARAAGGIGGLGLAIVQRVAQLHGGRLASEPGPGTCLALILPLSAV